MSSRGAKRRMVVIASIVVAGVGFLLIGVLSGGKIKTQTAGSAPPTSGEPVLATGTLAAFGYLAAQTSNRCGLTPAELQSYPPAQHLQGSCCSPMDLTTYQWQAKALRRYASIPQIPSDPYDVPVSLARELLGYAHSIRLSARQQASYDEAMHISRLHGPCCCHCWRWDAFRGMSMFLIARDGWKAAQVALLVDDLEGCGGKDEPPRMPGRATA